MVVSGAEGCWTASWCCLKARPGCSPWALPKRTQSTSQCASRTLQQATMADAMTYLDPFRRRLVAIGQRGSSFGCALHFGGDAVAYTLCRWLLRVALLLGVALPGIWSLDVVSIRP